MTTRRLTIEQFAKVVESLETDMKGAIVRGLQSAAIRMEGIVVEEIDGASPRPAVDEGVLRSSVQSEKVSNGAIVSMDAPHAAVMEEGARPFTPPIAPIREWVARKRIASGEEVDGIAYAVQAKIARDGIEPRHYFKKSFERTLPIVKQEIDRELEDL